MSNSFASLHAGLVARKGEAVPAVSHQAFSYVDAPQPGALEQRAGTPQTAQEEPVKHEKAPERVDAKPVAAPKTVQPKTAKPVQSKKTKKRSAAPFRLTFRMSHDQRRRMRIAAAQTDESLQHIISDAVDNYLDGLCACSLSECACMAREDA